MSALRATIVAPVITPDAHRIANELRQDALVVEVTSADVLRQPPDDRVYVFWCDAALAVVLAERIVQWGNGTCGLIGYVPDGGSDEREVLLAAGFDDVIAGRLSVRELSARLRVVHRRIHRNGIEGRLRYGELTLDLVHRILWTQGETIALTSTELEVMRALMNARGRPLSRVAILHAVRGGGESEVTERAVDNVILRLRRKLPTPDVIETLRGVGFRLAT